MMLSGRFVILEHRTAHGVHWDFMLEWGEVLRTWSLAQRPSPGCRVAATALPDHRMLFLDYEGPISRDRGTVTRWDRGTFMLLSESEGEVVVDLSGRRLAGRTTLSRDASGEPSWRFQIDV